MAGDETLTRVEPEAGAARASELLLSVVVPVYNLAGSIVANTAEIRRRIAAGLGEPFELIVVSTARPTARRRSCSRPVRRSCG